VGTIEQAKRKVLSFIVEIGDCIEVQLSSTKMLTFSVNDTLSLAQLNSSKFRKEITCFDIE
jgi:hypothetical protein